MEVRPFTIHVPNDVLASLGSSAGALVREWRAKRQMADAAGNRFYVKIDRPAPPPKSGLDHLTARENQVLHSLSLGYTYKEIADTLKISPDTARNHIRHIYEKLRVNSKTEEVLAYVGR